MNAPDYLSVFGNIELIQNQSNIYVLATSMENKWWYKISYRSVKSSYDDETGFMTAFIYPRYNGGSEDCVVRFYVDPRYPETMFVECFKETFDDELGEVKTVLGTDKCAFDEVAGLKVFPLSTALLGEFYATKKEGNDFEIRYYYFDKMDSIDIQIQYFGTIDASPLRSFAQTATAVEDLSENISGINPSALAEVKLPFNCKFGTRDAPGMNLSNVDKVSYTKFVKGKTYETEVVSNVIGMKEIAAGTFGDYAADMGLGVVLPTDASKLDVTTKTTDDGVAEFDLKAIAEDATYNAEDGNLKINTTYLSAKAHELAEDFTYNVGFTGAGNPIKISGTDKVATFKGDASGYTPTGDITLTNKTVYAGNNSFIKVNHAYDELEFTAAATGQTLANEIPSGVEVSATKFSVGKGHTLTVKGKLRA